MNTNWIRKETQRGLQKHVPPSKGFFFMNTLLLHFGICPYATSFFCLNHFLISQTSHLQPLPVLFLPTDFFVSLRESLFSLHWEKCFGCLLCLPRVHTVVNEVFCRHSAKQADTYGSVRGSQPAVVKL